jgi:hypothetical protein
MLAACHAELDGWCNQPANCPHATRGTLHARFDTTDRDHPKAWRCYATDTLSADRQSYSQGSTYCTRNSQLLALLQQCEGEDRHAHIGVEVSPTGETVRASASASAALDYPGTSDDASATGLFDTWLEQCAASAPRCSCLQHGTHEGSVELVLRHPAVAFFIVVAEAEQAEGLVSRLAAHNATNAYVMHTDLARRGALPLRNDVLNPRLGRLSALQALQTSNEFFDLQLVHASAVPSLLRPSPAEARSLLSLAATTLLLLPRGTAAASWRAALPALERPVPRAEDVVAAAAPLGVKVVAEGCTAGGRGLRGVGCATRVEEALLVRLAWLTRLTLHHLSCWEAPRCHDRMYVMSLVQADAPADGAAWARRVPALHRVEPHGNWPPGTHPFASVAEAVALRGKAIPFATGGTNLDTLVALRLHRTHRARLAAQFLAIPVGRDMMLWNIVAGREGAFAIDQEGFVYPDGGVPWERRAMPYCLTVRDCYEKPLGTLCGLPYTAPGRLYGAALTSAAAELFAAQCDDARRPYPCPNGCRASYEECHNGAGAGAGD